MITVGTMQLHQPEAPDAMEPFFVGGEYHTDMSRLSSHDHSGGLLGAPVAVTIPDGSITTADLHPSVLAPYALTDGSKPFTGQVTLQADAVVRDALVFGQQGSALAPDATLSRTGPGALRADTTLGVGVNPEAWHPGFRAVQVGSGGALFGYAGPEVARTVLSDNTVANAAGADIALLNRAGAQLWLDDGQVLVKTAPVASAGAAQTFTTRLTLGQAGTLGVGATPAAWHPLYRAVQVGAGGALFGYSGSEPARTVLHNNGVLNAAGADIATLNRAAAQLWLDDGQVLVKTAPVASVGAAQTFTTRMTLDQAGDLGVGVTPAAWHATRRAIQVGQAGVLAGNDPAPGLGVLLGENTYTDAGAVDRALQPGAATRALFGYAAGQVSFQNAPSVAAGAAQTFTTRMALAPTGTLTLTPELGQPALSAQFADGPGASVRIAYNPIGAGWTSIQSLNGALTLGGAGGYVTPVADNAYASGHSGARWTTVYAVAGTINTSSREAKEGVTPLDPGRAMQAVRNTEAVTFDYVVPEKPAAWYDLPDDPEQAEQVLAQRLTAAPLEAAARHQSGFVAEQADSLFLVGEGQTSPGNSVGVLLACLQNIDQRLQALEAA